MNCYLGIDFGTSGARAIAIDDNEQIVAEVSDRFGDCAPEQWANCWKAMLFGLIRHIPVVIRTQIRAIAINGTSSTVLLCDQTGTLLDAPIFYNDARGADLVATLQTLFAQDEYHQAPCQANVVNATSSLVKLLWWQQQSFFAQAQYFMHQADWLAFLLHGQLGISDYHNALKLGYDVAQLRYPDWLEALGVMRLLPKVLPPGSTVAPIQPAIARELGLPSTCMIHAGTTDSIAAFLASKASVPGEAVTSLGSTLVLKLLSTAPVENAAYGIYSHRLGDLWLVGGASNTGGAVLQQFFSPSELIQLSTQIPVEEESVLNYYPLTKPGERFPINDPNLAPRFDPKPDDPVAFLHGLLESMARIEAQGYRLLQQFGATPLTRVYTAGGGASNPAWTAIRARQLQVPVVASLQTEAAYGTALLAFQCCDRKLNGLSNG
ncbi:pentulose/hexulose kinase [Leptolyngbyaceae cyanobacterium JSC-12]|nr:pentulose/hexulose kinase [Leptolyngbyaceae cyanobacterium JSC-12]